MRVAVRAPTERAPRSMAIGPDYIDLLLPHGVPDAAWIEFVRIVPSPKDGRWAYMPAARFWDTRDGALRRNGIAVCTVRVGGRVKQALRTRNVCGARLFVADVDADRPSLAVARAAGWTNDVLPTRAALAPRFRLQASVLPVRVDDEGVDVSRIRGTLATIGTPHRERAFDIARVHVPTGDPAAAWRLARRLRETVRGAQLWFADEVDLGYALLDNGTAPPSRAVAVADGVDDLARAATSVAAQMLLHMCANVDGARDGRDPEHVHQMRIALRRLRAAARVANRAGVRLLSARAKRDIRRLARALGDARDWDVLAAATWPELAKSDEARRLRARVARAIERRRRERHDALREALSASFDELVLRIGAAVAVGARVRTSRADARAVMHLVSKLTRRVDRDASTIGRLQPSALHALRVDAKRLRYVAEVVAIASGDHAKRYVRRLTGVQAALGALNDLEVAGERLGDLDLGGRDRETLTKVWQDHCDREAPRLRRGFATAWKRFERAKPLRCR